MFHDLYSVNAALSIFPYLAEICDEYICFLCIECNETMKYKPKVGIEPTTYALRVRCSTAELFWLDYIRKIQ